MKTWKTWQIILFTALCVLLNFGGRMLSVALGLPLWLDSFGTVLCAYLAGPVCGAIVGMTGNLMYASINRLSAVYSLTSIAMGFIVGMAARRRALETRYGMMKTTTMLIVVSVAVSVPINAIFAGGYTGNRWGNGVVDYLLMQGWPQSICIFIGQLAVEFLDKVFTMLILYIVLVILRWHTRNREEHEAAEHHMPHSAAAATAVALAIALAACCGTARAEEAPPNYTDYNDYVQTVFGSSNGLPCGEANDIAQTRDGALWIGTYAGLYRFNGREFRWIDNYASVKNVNCLYVDDEGRLWIGTNDSGLSISIRDQVANVLDQSTGLPSNSVRSIIQSSDGYYYVGTTGSMQMLLMNNGLKITNTLWEVNYASSIAADERGHVAAVASGGRLFLMRGGQILSSLRLTESQEQFNCCAFAPNGELLAGSSLNHIYRYDISSGAFSLIGTVTCEGLTGIKNLRYLPDGTLFVSSDSGVSYFDPGRTYHRVNTNAFDNSIDNILMDYQGNLWFTSSRLGLLRLASSSFRDIYGTIGMDRKVVNTVVKWQGNYCIGTDKGLDVVDENCRMSLTTPLSEKLKGIRIRCMLVDSWDHLWVCTYGSGLWEVSPDNEIWVYDAENGGFGNRARTVTQLKDGTILAAGNTGISYIRDHRVLNTLRYEDGLINSMILTLTERADGSILAGTDGDGIAVLKDGKVTSMLTREDGLSSGVVMRTTPDPKSGGVFIVTSNGLCYMDEQDQIRTLDQFPYFNNYDIWARDDDELYVLGSAGIYVVSRDELLSGGTLNWELLDARSGLSSSLTANAWVWFDSGHLFLPCDTGVYIIDVNRLKAGAGSYRMSLASVRLDGEPQPLERTPTITVGRGISRVELRPEILNYTIQDPNAGYWLEGYDGSWTILSQSSLNSIIYTNLPAGTYTFHLGVFDVTGENLLEERVYTLTKEGELYDEPEFKIYILFTGIAFVIWLTWMIVERKVQQQQRKLDMANETIMAIANAVDAKDERTSQHSLRVAEYSVLIARELGWSRKECENLRKAAQMHDIGKIGIPDLVLNKPARLTDDEYKVMKSHVTRGADILKDFTLIDHAADGARFHHERYDGRGYPDGLKGEEIPIYGRVIGVADAFDAMTSNRVYRNQMDTDYVMEELHKGRGTQFDPDVLDAFMRLIDEGVINLDQIYAEKIAAREEAERSHQAAASAAPAAAAGKEG
ncbi:MAG: HD domain-containing protein [Clostridia bacterium]|nr:HD domain-containing protein [Clostridia bacterium]